MGILPRSSTMRAPFFYPMTTRRAPRAAAGLVLALALGCSSHSSPQGRLTIAYSNDLHGEIRSCGCAADDFGGLGRRATFLADLRDTTGDFLLLDGGDIFGTGINYGKEKADLTLKSMARMGYQGVVVGEQDFGFGTDYIVRRPREVGLPVLAANVFASPGDTLLFPPSREVTLASGLRVGLIGVLSQHVKLPPQVPEGSVVVRDPGRTIAPIVQAMRPKVDLVVVLAHMERGEAQSLAEALPDVDLIIHGHDGRALRHVRRFGHAYVLQVAQRGLYMGVAYATLGKDHRIATLENAVFPMDNSYADDEGIAKLFQAYDLDIAAKEKSLLPTGITNAAQLGGERFAGVGTCKTCHADIVATWEQSKHAHAFATLESEKREYDRDCTPCHSTGFYKRGGFVSATATPALENVQCEACHGNAADHAANPSVRTTAAARQACMECHTAERSPHFDFAAYWPRIQHGTAVPPGAAKAR
jgi:Cytochrome c554 and c-prime